MIDEQQAFEDAEARVELEAERRGLRAEIAALRQQLAEAQTQLAVCSCGTSPMTCEGPEPDCPVHGAVRAFNEAQATVEELAGELADERTLHQKTMAELTTAQSVYVELELLEAKVDAAEADRDRLQVERDEARGDAERMRVVLALYGDGIDPNGYYEGTPGSRLRQLLSAEADRDRLLVVYRAAEAWAEVGRTRTSQTGNSSIWLHEYGNRRDALIAAVDAYRSAAPAEPAAALNDQLWEWRLGSLKQAIIDQAPVWENTFPEGNTGLVVGVPDAAVVALRWFDGDTPGELVPGEGEQVLPVDGAS